MNVFNRVVTVLLLLVLLAVALALAIVPMETVRAGENALRGLGGVLAGLEKSRMWLYVLLRVGLALVALLIFVVLLWSELRPRRPKAAQVRSESGSNASVTTESIARRLAWHIDQLADVVSVTPDVSASGKVVNVRLMLETRPEIDIPMKTEEVIGLAREIITDRMGLQLGKIDVRISHAAYQESA